jgi:membrane protease YdiL (CAAX protease family)
MQWFQWIALLSVCVATGATIAIWEHGRWALGLRTSSLLGAKELLLGIAFGALLVGIADGLVMVSTPLRHLPGSGIPWRELMIVFLPAVLHEELLFRGYLFQKVRTWNRRVAIVIVSLLFAALHLWNDDITVLAITNIYLGGIRLSLAYERLMSGPILGYEVSGFRPDASVLAVTGEGPMLLTGGKFGIEGSVWMTLVELSGIAVLTKRRGIQHSS